MNDQRKLSDEEALEFLRLIVKNWEAIPARVDAFCKQYGQQYQRATLKLAREAACGEEAYLEAKRLIEIYEEKSDG